MAYILAVALVALMLIPIIGFALQDWSPTYVERLADAIYRAEGGDKAHQPYGIETIKCDTEAKCRRICKNTIINHAKRHSTHCCGDDFLTCLAKRYCPPNWKNWLSNVKYFLEKGEEDGK
jgi:hypothetical protein